MSLVRFAVDFDGTIVEDDKYPEIGDWIPGAAKGIRALERIGRVVIYSCRTANAHYLTEAPRGQAAIDAEISAIRAKLAEEDLDHLEIWTKPYKPPAAAYIDNKAVAFRGDWEQAVEDTLDLICPLPGLHTTAAPMAVRLVEKPTEMYGEVVGPSVVEDRHPSSVRFHEILKELGDLHDQKSIGYGTNEDPLANVRGSQDWGVPAWQGAMLRAGDKIKRLQSFVQKGELPFEAIEDAFRDLAVYSVIALVLFEEEQA